MRLLLRLFVSLVLLAATSALASGSSRAGSSEKSPGVHASRDPVKPDGGTASAARPAERKEVVDEQAAVRNAVTGKATSRSADALRDLLLPGAVEAVRLGLRVETGPHTAVPWRQPYKDATERYSLQVKLGPDGGLLNYIAGLPFVGIDANDPQAGTKIMWNHAFNPWADDDAVARSVDWATGNLKPGHPMSLDSGDNVQDRESKWLKLVGRLYVDPVYSFRDNRDGVMSMQALGPTFPALLTLVPSGPLLTYRYLGSREDDVWYYVSLIRRLRRLSPQVRYNTPGEVVIDLNSGGGFNAPVLSYSWRLLGEKPQLGVMNAAEYPSKWCPGAGDFAACDKWEPRTAYIVEGTARLPYDVYSKRIVVIDKDAWVALASDLYDKDQELWKTILCFWSYRMRTTGEGSEAKTMPHLFLLSGSAVDLQKHRALRWRLPGTQPLDETVEVNTGLTPDDFSIGRIGSAFR
jgi:hypothetical protein